MYEYEQIPYKGYTIEILYDENAESPRTAFENLGTLYTAHRRYRPEKDFDKHFNIDEVFEGRIGDFRDTFLKNYIALPVYLYDHSGLAVSTAPFSCPWDSGFFGIIAVSLEKVRKEYGWSNITAKRRARIEEYLQGEIKELDDYYHGDVFGYRVIREDTGEETDSCWGYYGTEYLEELKKEVKAKIDADIKAEKQACYKRLLEKAKQGVQLCLPLSAYPALAHK